MTNIFHGKKVIVTGSTGFKGSWLCLWLKNGGNFLQDKYIYLSIVVDKTVPPYFVYQSG